MLDRCSRPSLPEIAIRRPHRSAGSIPADRKRPQLPFGGDFPGFCGVLAIGRKPDSPSEIIHRLLSDCWRWISVSTPSSCWTVLQTPTTVRWRGHQWHPILVTRRHHYAYRVFRSNTSSLHTVCKRSSCRPRISRRENHLFMSPMGSVTSANNSPHLLETSRDDETGPLFTPQSPEDTRTLRFMQRINSTHSLSLASYKDLYTWSTTHTDKFWSYVWDDTDILGDKGTHVVNISALPPDNPPWFTEAKLNWAENMLRCRSPHKFALIEASMSFLVFAIRQLSHGLPFQLNISQIPLRLPSDASHTPTSIPSSPISYLPYWLMV